MPRHGRMTTERAKDFKGTLRQLLAAMSKYKLSLVVVIVFACSNSSKIRQPAPSPITKPSRLPLQKCTL